MEYHPSWTYMIHKTKRILTTIIKGGLTIQDLRIIQAEKMVHSTEHGRLPL